MIILKMRKRFNLLFLPERRKLPKIEKYFRPDTEQQLDFIVGIMYN